MSDIKYSSKKLVAVEYPGIFRSVDKMLETLGGQRSVDKAYSKPSRRLDLRFRPQDPHCKCAHGDRVNTTNLLLRVKKRQKQSGDNGFSCVEDGEYVMEIIGVIETTYKFRAMMDFQYLPMEHTSEKKYKSFASEVIPRGMQMSSWLNKPAPLHVLPVQFSRIDAPSSYYYKTESTKKTELPISQAQKESTIIGKGRVPRQGWSIGIEFDDPVPEKPKDDYETQLSSKLPVVEDIRKAFEERPIWSKTGLASVLDVEESTLKHTLPAVAYYFTTGPWRSLWVRYSYDPRKISESKIYQLLDFRVSQAPGRESHIHPKRSTVTYALPNKASSSIGRVSTIQTEELILPAGEGGTSKNVSKEEKESKYIFKPDHLPLYRQNFYQLCDIFIPEVQRLIHCNDGAETGCAEKDGWLKPGTLEECRRIMRECVEKTIRKNKEKEKLSSDLTSRSQALAESNTSDQDYIPSDEDPGSYSEED